ncbi:hypothetical protein SAY86_018140 [Trapa natans]|uniref:Uncharacterized protein n=1 Tax=Trapa natans TaxID=22666 RepID=A0AAN7LQB1_TRANT|nr:hypothetical protein SAY86_018140 [Trapa natans]
MESMKKRLFFAVVLAVMAVSALEKVAAAEAPAPGPGPASDAAALMPAAAFASLAALAFGYLF